MNTKIKSTLRSLYRLTELHNLNSPQIMIENEKVILIKRLLELDGKEILDMAGEFSEYHQKQKVKDAINDENFFNELNKELGRQN